MNLLSNNTYISKIELENYKCFERLNINFDKHLTVIVGNNGSGKSSVLDACRIALSAYLMGFDGFSNETINKKDVRRRVYQLGSNEEIQSQYPAVIDVNCCIRDSLLYWDHVKKSEKSNVTSGLKEASNLGKRDQEMVREGNKNLILPLMAYYGTNRLWNSDGKTKEVKNFSRISGYTNCLKTSLSNSDMLIWFKKMTIQTLQRNEKIVEFDMVCKAIEETIKLISDYKNIKVSYNFDLEDIEISYINGEKKERLPLVNLSDGYRSTICLVIDIAYRMALLNPQLLSEVLKTPGIVLIDEIDLHLHPSWQQIILKNLTTIFPNVQFIVTTHAAAVINSCKNKHLIILEEMNSYTFSNKTYGRDVNSILREVMNVEERPIEVVQLFEQFYRNLDKKEFDACKKIIEELEEIVGNKDPSLTSCKTTLELELL